jgi:anthranilate phosphoribosyltransferase
MENIKLIFKNYAYQNKPLGFEQGYDLASFAIEGCRGNNIAAIQSLALLCALHNKATYRHPDSYIQIAGIVAGVIDADVKTSEFGLLSPCVPYVVDNSGMGGDHIITANISTLASFICASLGIYMCKHGSPANSDKGLHGSSDFVSLCGIPTDLLNTEICKSVEENRWGYIEACDTRFKLIHTQTHKFAQLSHMNDLLGPLTAPINPDIAKYKVVGINSLLRPIVVAKACQLLNEKGVTKFENALFIQGNLSNKGHVDELVLTSHGTNVAELTKENKLIEYKLYPEDFGIEQVHQKFLSPPFGMSKGAYSHAILHRELVGPVDQIVAANAAIIIRMVHAIDLKDALQECLSEITKIKSFVSQLKSFEHAKI